METRKSARDVGAKKIQNWRTQRETAGDKVKTRKFGMWKTATMVRSRKSLISLNFLFYKKVLEEFEPFSYFLQGVAGNEQKLDFLGPKVGGGKSEKIPSGKTPDFPEFS